MSINVRSLARRVLPPESTVGGLARDVYRLLNGSRPGIEDVLEALALTIDGLVFIQVGSNDAQRDDPLQRFITSHRWRGIMVEPVPYVFERLKRHYGESPNLILENVAIAERDGDTDFYYLEQANDPLLPEWYDRIGSLSTDVFLKHQVHIPNIMERIVKRTVPCLTFESLCRKHNIEHIDLVHIDAEGYDFEIIKLIDFTSHSPLAILYEHMHLGSAYEASREYLRQRGYELLQDRGDILAIHRRARARPLSRLGRTWFLATRS